MMYEFSHLVFSHHKGVSEMINMTRILQNLDICTHESIFIIAVFARLYRFKTRFCVEYVFCSNYKSILISVLVVTETCSHFKNGKLFIFCKLIIRVLPTYMDCKIITFFQLDVDEPKLFQTNCTLPVVWNRSLEWVWYFVTKIVLTYCENNSFKQ